MRYDPGRVTCDVFLIAGLCANRQPLFLSPIPTTLAAEGDDVTLTCLVYNLGPHKVSWYRAESGEMLVFETRVLSPDERVRAEHTRPNSWLLRIAQVRTSDAGLYACVVDSTPRLSQLGALEVRPLRGDERSSRLPPSNSGSRTSSAILRKPHRDLRQWKKRKHRFVQEPSENKGKRRPRQAVTVHKDEPYFAEPIPSLTVAAGRNAALKCVVENLGNYTVAWLNVDKQTLLALHTHVIVQNDRIRVSHGSLRSWQLEIRDVKPEDTGYYMCQVNTRPMKNQVGYLNVVVAPYFVDAFTARNLTARENSNVSFRCEASGNPEPKITWRREDGQSFRLGDQKVSVYRGPELHFPRVSRSQMGAYLCLASNGVPPSISRRIFLEVTFTPMIWVPNQVVGAALGSSVALECHTEAHPASENFWFRSSRRLDGDLSANGLKHKKPKRHEASTTKTGLKVYMKLSMWNLRKEDYGTYHCVAQNALDRTEGKIQLHEIAAPSGKTEPPPELPVPVTTSERNQGGTDKQSRTPKSDVVPGPRQTDKGQGRWAIQHFQDGSHEKKESSRGRAGEDIELL
ncbi:hemicentin-2 [Ixodes scapularis]|uniref:hemicentin-2 n=1 Tax=Ixodes scapularis TaxID=6945 RepID=UPI001C37ED64|nr:hemicentin-2 [Ixodes scapularis]